MALSTRLGVTVPSLSLLPRRSPAATLLLLTFAPFLWAFLRRLRAILLFAPARRPHLSGHATSQKQLRFLVLLFSPEPALLSVKCSALVAPRCACSAPGPSLAAFL
eukprot:3279031-Pyramimonas_sp.AAC.1